MAKKKCEVTKNKDGSVTVETYPDLWEDIRKNVSNIDNAIAIYTRAFDNSFQEQKISNPKFIQVINSIDLAKEKKFSNKFTKKERQRMVDYNTMFPGFQDKIVDAFTTKEGVFGVDVAKALGQFSLNQVLSMRDNHLKEIEPLYYKLRNEISIKVPTLSYSLIKTNEDGSMVNPDETIAILEQNFTGLKTRAEIMERSEEIDYDITEEEIEFVLDNLSDKTLVGVYSVDGVRKKINSTFDTLTQTLNLKKISRDRTIVKSLNVLAKFTEENWNSKKERVQKLLETLVEDAKDKNINLDGLEELLEERTYQEYKVLLGGLYDMVSTLKNAGANTNESLATTIQTFSDIYDTFFDEGGFYINEVGEEGTFVIDGRITEADAYRQFKAIKVGPRTYKKVPRKSLPKVREEIYATLKPDNPITKLEIAEHNKEEILNDIDKYLGKKAQSLPSNKGDLTTLKITEGNKLLRGIEGNYFDTVYFPSRPVDTDSYEEQVRQEMLDNPELQEIIGFSNEGIELLQSGPYTNEYLKNNLPSYNKLVNYAILTNRNSLQGLIPTSRRQEKREFYVNNPHMINEFKGDYLQEETTIITRMDSEEYIRINNDIFEKTGDNQYEKVADYTVKIQTDLKKPKKRLSGVKGRLKKLDRSIKVNKGDDSNLGC